MKSHPRTILLIGLVVTAAGFYSFQQFYAKDSDVIPVSNRLPKPDSALSHATPLQHKPVRKIEAPQAEIATDSLEKANFLHPSEMYLPGYPRIGTDHTSVANPGDLYSANIEDAMKGVPDAAYNVWVSLNACKSAIAKSVIEEGRASGEYREIDLEHTAVRSQLCEPLTKQVGFENLRSDAAKFLRASADAGNNRARIQLAVHKRPKPAIEDIESILASALHDPDHLVFDAATGIQAEYYEYNEAKIGAWRLLTCQSHEFCDAAQYRALLKQELYTYRYEEALTFLGKLEVELSNGTVEGALALVKGNYP